MPQWKRFDPTDMHWLLIERGKAQREQDAAVSDDGWVASQALFCPYYAPIEGILGSDWGVILNPESTKFGQLAFEHEWCGCPSSPNETSAEWFADHGGGSQSVDEWATPRSRWKMYRRARRPRAS